MTVDKNKVNIILAKSQMNVSELCKKAGISKNRVYVILNSKKVAPKTVGRLAEVLGVDVTEIIETEN